MPTDDTPEPVVEWHRKRLEFVATRADLPHLSGSGATEESALDALAKLINAIETPDQFTNWP